MAATVNDPLMGRLRGVDQHVAGLDDLRRRVALMAAEELGAVLHTAILEGEVMRRQGGRTGAAHKPESDIHALAAAYRRYALDHPGRYAATVRAARAGDRELEAASEATVRTAAISTHQQQSEDGRRLASLPANLVRLNVGAEHREDIIADLEQALSVLD